MSKIETNTIDTVSGTTNLTIGSTNSSTVTFENGAVTGHNYPAFSVYKSSQNLTNDTFVKIQFDTETFDTDGAFDSSTNYRFTVPSGGDGKYLFITTVQIRDTGNNSTVGRCRIYKNGTGIDNAALANTDLRNAEFREINIGTHVIDTAVAGDYYEVFAYIFENSASGQVINISNFSGYRIGA